MRKFDLIIFDMAGTTVADHGEVPTAFLAALAEFEISIAPEELNKVRGASKREALAKLLGATRAHLLDAIYARFVETLSATYRSGANEIPGAMNAFRFFKGAGLKLALNTGFERSLVDLLLEALDWPASMFDAIVCGDEVAHGRPAPDLIFRAMQLAGVNTPERVINVGDTTLDMEAGACAAVGANIAVLSGAHKRDQLAAAPHTHMVSSVRELPALFAN